MLSKRFQGGAAECPQARLLLAGDGECRAELESLRKSLGKRMRCCFPVLWRMIEEVYAALDAFVFPSEFEGLGTALQAAMAMGCRRFQRGGALWAKWWTIERTALVVEPNAQRICRCHAAAQCDAAAARARLGAAGEKGIKSVFRLDAWWPIRYGCTRTY